MGFSGHLPNNSFEDGLGILNSFSQWYPCFTSLSHFDLGHLAGFMLNQLEIDEFS